MKYKREPELETIADLADQFSYFIAGVFFLNQVLKNCLRGVPYLPSYFWWRIAVQLSFEFLIEFFESIM